MFQWHIPYCSQFLNIDSLSFLIHHGCVCYHSPGLNDEARGFGPELLEMPEMPETVMADDFCRYVLLQKGRFLWQCLAPCRKKYCLCGLRVVVGSTCQPTSLRSTGCIIAATGYPGPPAPGLALIRNSAGRPHFSPCCKNVIENISCTN